MILAIAKGLVLRASGNTHLYRELNGNGNEIKIKWKWNGNGNEIKIKWKWNGNGTEVEMKWK